MGVVTLLNDGPGAGGLCLTLLSTFLMTDHSTKVTTERDLQPNLLMAEVTVCGRLEVRPHELMFVH